MSDTATSERRPPRHLDVVERIWPVMRRAMHAHTLVYKATGGRLGNTLPGVGGKMLLLDHVGAKSGKLRTSPLLFVPDGDDYLVIASKGGHPKNPAWLHNLVAHPDTFIQIGSERHPVHARVAKPEERERLWGLADAAYAGYADYRARTDRQIPLVLLEPR